VRIDPWRNRCLSWDRRGGAGTNDRPSGDVPDQHVFSWRRFSTREHAGAGGETHASDADLVIHRQVPLPYCGGGRMRSRHVPPDLTSERTKEGQSTDQRRSRLDRGTRFEMDWSAPMSSCPLV